MELVRWSQLDQAGWAVFDSFTTFAFRIRQYYFEVPGMGTRGVPVYAA